MHCARCEEDKPLVRNRSTKSGFGSYCNACAVLQVIESKVRHGWVRRVALTKEQALERRRARRYEAKYGITRDQFLELAQNGCRVCGARESQTRWRTLHVDHDHSCCPGERTCGKCVRGVLCSRCNLVLGHVKDDPDVLRKLLLYLCGGSS